MTNNFTPINDLMKNKNIKGSSGFSKEIVPPKSTKGEYVEIEEVVEHKPEKEVEEYITTKAESIDLPPDIKKLGVQSTPSTTKFPTLQSIKLPISDDKIMTGLHAPISSSLRWLATLAKYILACAHIGLKKVHGKVIRFIKT